jgi:GNAT superfamily N-acetyltransferase
MFRIRRAKPEDAKAIKEIQARGWKFAYTGILSPELIESKTNPTAIEESAKKWAKTIESPAEHEIYFVAEEDGRAVGFASGGNPREKDTGFDRELACLYVDPPSAQSAGFHKRGIGRELMFEFARTMMEQGAENFGVICLSLNKNGMEFYEHVGGRRLFSKPNYQGYIGIDGKPAEETCWGYSIADFLKSKSREK